MLRLIVLFTVFYFAQSKTDECFNSTECESNPPLKITNNPRTQVLLAMAGDRVSLVCGVKPVDSSAIIIYWTRNNSDGHPIKLNSTSILNFFGEWTANLKDVPPAGKYPYKYQCVATLKCCTVRSSPSTVTISPQLTGTPSTISPQLTVRAKGGGSPLTYPGHGPVEVECNGRGDNSTSVYWIRTDSKNKTLIRNSTELEFHDITSVKLWQAELEEHPPKEKFPLTYQCVVSNKCCKTIKSPLIKVKLVDTTGQGCQSATLPIAFFRLFKAIPRKRSMEIVWDYVKGTTDAGFRLKWNKATSLKSSTIKLDIDTRRYVVNNLVPSTNYQWSLFVHYEDNCSSIATSIFKRTLLDYPGKPINLTATAVNATVIRVTWSPPNFSYGHLLGYIVFWRQNNTEEDYQVTLRNTSTHPARLHVIANLKEETYYEITVLAINSLGNGNRANPVYVSTQRKPTVKAKTGDSDAGAIAGSVIAVIFLIILVLIGVFIFRKRVIQKRRKESVKSFHAMHGVAHNNSFASEPQRENYPPPTPQPLPEKSDLEEEAAVSYIVLLDDWEILRENLKILEKKLGGGQFGIVKQGLYKSDKNESEIVAVKMLKDGAGESDRSDLLTELQILKEVNKMPHPNVLKLIGACSAAEPLLVVTEFCSSGNLRRFLINSRVDSSDESPSYINLSSALTHRQLLKIAIDVTSGMIHLASYKFVHRDLAARNVLIGDDNTAKLSDFGLARDIRGAEEYIRSNQNLLPVKWMALESLLEGRFTTASDIWSFGVLLYEITTLGEEPYRGISPYNIVSHVGSGCRMEKPRHCSEEVYTIMRNCWKVDPDERPTFEEINEALYAMLTDDEKSYINITQVIDEGPLLSPTNGNNMSFKDASVRYTTA